MDFLWKRIDVAKTKNQVNDQLAGNISKSFDKRVILRKIDIHLNAGEMLGLLGSNGAGKSTFMNIVLGILKPDYGDIFLGNLKLTNLAIHQRAKLGIAYLPQQTSIFRGLTVYENLLSIAQIVKKRESDQKSIVEKLMAEFSITHLRNIKGTALSGGERRRTEIARCLINDPKVLLLDEPFAGVDLLSLHDIKELLLKLQFRGCAVLVTDHNASQLLSVVDRAYVVASGSIVAQGTPKEIANTPPAKKLYFGEDFNFNS
jgi:lipopolysaccharide export system ATP-binding protein